MRKRTFVYMLFLQIACFNAVLWYEKFAAQEPVLAYQAELTPVPFLGPIYYGQEAILNVFDHELPLFRPADDGNNNVRHYNGVTYLAVTPTPSGDPYIPIEGYGYDQHVGIDYNLRYEPVLAAANGQVAFAGWSDPTNHRRLYGLHVQMNHHDNLDYRTWYGHLSTLTVKTGDLVLINPASPADRNRTLGISGNTGSLEGCNAPVNDDPLCSAHLHFEVRQRNVNRPTNPYGWVAPIQTVDPWSVYVNPQGTPAGATSYDLWATRPAVTSAQYGTGGEALVEPPVTGARMIIDDASADFRSAYGGIEPPPPTMDMPMPDCWQQVSDSAAYNHAYRRVLVNDRGKPTCGAFWYVRPDAFTPPGDYDVFVHVPPGNDQTLGAAYTIRHNGQTHTAQPTPTPSPTPAPATHTPTPPPSSTPTPAPTATATVTGQATPLTAFPDSLVYDAVWSPDVAQVAFTADDAIWLVTPGQSPTQITQSMTARHPAWLVENN